MQKWENPEMWTLDAECTKGGNDGNDWDGEIFQGPFGKFGGLNSGTPWEDIPGYKKVK